MIASISVQKALQYVDDVLSGDQVACKLVKAACERHVRDMKRQDTKRFPYRFDAQAAAIACEFYPTVLRHSIGEFSGLPFELEPWQLFGIASIFGWKHSDTNARRFRKVYWAMGRKNGKSCIAAGIALYMASMDVNPKTNTPENVAQVVLSAPKKEQASKVIYAEICRMREASRALAKRSTDKNNQVEFTHNQGFICCVGSDRGMSGLSPHCVVMDELHEWKETVHRKFYDTMQTGGGSRIQPLTVTVTTAGDDCSYIWLDEYRYAKRVVRQEVKDDRLFALSYELDTKDDLFDEANWIKGNPNLGVSVKHEYLEDQAREAKQSKVATNRFKRYHCNNLVSSLEAAFDLPQWDKCQGVLSDWRQADALGAGVDLGGRDDMAAFAIVARFLLPDDQQPQATDDDPDPKPLYRYEGQTWAYIANDCSRDLTVQPFADWVHSDLLRACAHPNRELADALVEKCIALGVEDVAYDPHGGQLLAEQVENDGIDIASMSQTCRMFNEPIGDFMECVQSGRFTHDGNPLLRWCIGNTIVISDRQERWMFDKKASSEKIDPVVALIMAFRRACVAPANYQGTDLFITG